MGGFDKDKRVPIPQRLLSLVVLAALSLAMLPAQSGTLDLTALANYANQPRPGYITQDNTTAGNPITDTGATLGRVLFYDKRLSRNNSISCASCHQQTGAFSDAATASTGVSGTTGRHAMRLINTRFAAETRFFWDKRTPTLEDQATQPLKDHIEMGFSGTSGDPAFPELLNKLSVIPEYRVLFTVAFGTPVVDEMRIRIALAQFLRSIQSFDSKYDIGRGQVASDGVPFPNYSTSENAGKELFLRPPGSGGGAGCNRCHHAPEFDISVASGNNGVAGAIKGGNDFTVTRSPTLRDLVAANGQAHGPFMHNGVFPDLAALVNHYNAIPAVVPGLDQRLRSPPDNGPQRLNLSEQQKSDLIAFLKTLTGDAVYTDPKWSDPFGPGGEFSIMPFAEMKIENAGVGTATLSCKAIAGFQYVLQTSADLRTWVTTKSVSPNANDTLSETLSTSGPMFHRFALVIP